MREKAIEEYNPGFGVFSGPEYENYVNSLYENVMDVVIEHLNFTKNLFYEAQLVREQVLNDGGTAEEAQNAYLEKISTSRETIENLGNNSTEIPKNQNNQKMGENATTQSVLISEEDSENNQKTSISVTVDETVVEVDYKESIFSVEVNGKVLLFTVENGQIIQINDS